MNGFDIADAGLRKLGKMYGHFGTFIEWGWEYSFKQDNSPSRAFLGFLATPLALLLVVLSHLIAIPILIILPCLLWHAIVYFCHLGLMTIVLTIFGVLFVYNRIHD